MAQTIISIIVGIVGFATFTYLLVAGTVGTFSYSSLLALLALVCIVIPVLGRLREFDLKNLKLTLDRIEEAKKEIYAKEESLKRASHVLAELIAANSAVTGVWSDEESNEYSKSLIRSKIRKLGEQMDFSRDEMDQIFRYESALAEVHHASMDEVDEKWEKFKLLLKEEADRDA